MENQISTINQTVGAHIEGNVTAERIEITVVNSPSTSSTTAAVSNPPFRFNNPTPTRHFKGRRDTMKAIRDYFTTLPLQSIDCWERIAAVVGLGGMGKTETAGKFAAEFKETFPNVAWINAETQSSALTSFLGVAKILKIVSYDRKEADVDLVRQVYRHLDQEDYGRVLFVFDNAIRLNSGAEEFGIMDYLPTDDLPNQRYPYVLITTQTHDWERLIETFQVDELSEVESLQFFRSCFQIETLECDDLFRKLHELLQGYPLVMNLAASQVDYNPKKDSVHHLKQQINNYNNKLKENNKILNEKFKRAWPTKYHKTLATVWQLTFERIHQEDNGHDALELLQLMSFLHVPIASDEVVRMLFRSSDCPHPPKKEMESRLKELFRVLERFYTVRILQVYKDDEEGFKCELGIHRLVQLVVRQQMDSSKVLEGVLFYFASDYVQNDRANASALEEALRGSRLSERALSYVGILACRGFPAACKYVETIKPEAKAAASIWQLYNLEKGKTTLNENAMQVLCELIGLTQSEERLEDRELCGEITSNLLLFVNCFDCKRGEGDGAQVPGYSHLASLDGVKGLVAEFIFICSLQDSKCKSDCDRKDRENRDDRLSTLTVRLSKTFIRVGTPKPTLNVDVIADTWIALFSRLRYYDVSQMREFPSFVRTFWRDMYKTFHSPDVSQSSIVVLRTCLWNRGLALELTQVFGFTSSCFPHLSIYNLDSFVLYLMDVCLDGMDLRDERVQQVMSAFCQMITTIEVEFISKDYMDADLDQWIYFAVDVSSVWIKLFLMDDEPPSQELIESLSHLKFLDWMERSPKINHRQEPFFRRSSLSIPFEYEHKYFSQFMLRFSSSDIQPIKTLTHVCQRLMADRKQSHRWL